MEKIHQGIQYSNSKLRFLLYFHRKCNQQPSLCSGETKTLRFGQTFVRIANKAQLQSKPSTKQRDNLPHEYLQTERCRQRTKVILRDEREQKRKTKYYWWIGKRRDPSISKLMLYCSSRTESVKQTCLTHWFHKAPYTLLCCTKTSSRVSLADFICICAFVRDLIYLCLH